MFKKLLDFIKNLFKPSTKKYEGESPYKYDYNTEPQDKTWKDKQEEKLSELENRLNDVVPTPTETKKPAPTKKPIEPIVDYQEQFLEHINMLIGSGFNEHGKGVYMKETPDGLFTVNFMELKMTKSMGLTSIDAKFSEGPESIEKISRFLMKHKGL